MELYIMEIDITTLTTEADMFEFSASMAERGMNAGPETWANAKAEAEARPILSDDQLPEFRDYMRGFGAWDADEINAWDATECNALFVQFVAGDLREAESLCPGDGPGGIDWEAYAKLAEEGTCSGRIYPGDDGKIYAYIGD
jgi:hypothetical protein